MGSFRPVLLAVIATALVAAGPAHARHSYPATYTGTHSGGGAVEFDVNAEGTYVTRFALTNVPTPCGLVTTATNAGATLAAITDHQFSRSTTANGATSFSGSFPGFQQASGTLTHKVSSICNSGELTWTATTAAPPPPQCNDGVDNDGDGQTDYPADFSCLSASENDESLDRVAPAAPAIQGTDPAPPSNNATPHVRGSNAEPGSTVKIYGDGACAGAVLGSGSADTFNSPAGIAAAVPPNQTTGLQATATDAAGNVSPCSDPFTYTHDGIAPPTLTITGTDPPSPSSVATPLVRGQGAEPGSVVRIYADPACSGPEVGSGDEGAFHGAGIPAALGSDQTAALRATATDAAGNVSPCSAAVIYARDSTAPDTTFTSGPPATTTDATPTFEFAASEAGATFMCQVDMAPFVPCGSPFTAPTLAVGAHTFAVRASDAAGNTDPSPATRSFTVERSQPPPPPEDTTLVLRATARSPQRAVRQRGLVLYARCPGEPCTARASGYVDVPAAASASARFKLKPVQKPLAAGVRTKFKLRFSAKLLRKVRAALRDPARRGRVRSRLKVRATDRAGNSNTKTFKVRITR